jgi:hypothetical protein
MPEAARIPTAKSKHLFIRSAVLIAVSLAVISAFFIYRQTKFQTKSKVSSKLLSKSNLTVRPLPSGKQTYIFNSNHITLPAPSEVVIDPLTPVVGTNQTILVKIKHPSPIVKAAIILHTDNKDTEYPLQLTNGTSTDGTWEASWLMTDSYNYTYYLQFDITSALGNYRHGLVFR